MRSGYKGLQEHDHESITAVIADRHMVAMDSLISIIRIKLSLHEFCCGDVFFLTEWNVLLMPLLHSYIFFGGGQIKMFQVILRVTLIHRTHGRSTTVISFPL